MTGHLLKLVEDLQLKIAQLVRAAGDDIGQEDPPRGVPETDLIESILSFRHRRSAIFPASLFGEPAWDMLLLLYCAHLEGRPESESRICAAAEVPRSTASRWIGALERGGWIARGPGPEAESGFNLELSEQGRNALDRLFAKPPLPLP